MCLKHSVNIGAWTLNQILTVRRNEGCGYSSEDEKESLHVDAYTEGVDQRCRLRANFPFFYTFEA